MKHGTPCRENGFRFRREASASRFQRQNGHRDVGQVIVELVVAAGQAMDLSLRNRACVKIDVRGRHDVVVQSVPQVNGNVFGQACAQIRGNAISSLGQPPSPAKAAASRKIAPHALGVCSVMVFTRMVPPTECPMRMASSRNTASSPSIAGLHDA